MSLLLVPDPNSEILLSQGTGVLLHTSTAGRCSLLVPAHSALSKRSPVNALGIPFGTPSPRLHFPFRAVDFKGTAERTCPTYTPHFPVKIFLLLLDLDQGCSQPSETGSVNAPNYTLQWGFILQAPELDHEAFYIYMYIYMWYTYVCACSSGTVQQPPSAGRAHPEIVFHVL